MKSPDFLNSILKSLEKAKDPLFFGGVICVLLIGFILFYYKKGTKKQVPVNIILYGILFIAITSVLTGLYLKTSKNTVVIYGRLDYNCKPAKDVEVFTSRLRVAKTEEDGSFHFDISGMNFKNLRLLFISNGTTLGDTSIPVKAFEEELKMNFGDCSLYTNKIIKGKVIRRLDEVGEKGLTVSLVGYNYYTTTLDNGDFTLKADSILKSDIPTLEMQVSGKYEGIWPLNTFKGIIPVDKRK